MGDLVKTPLFYEEMGNKIFNKNIFRKQEKKMSEVTNRHHGDDSTKQPKVIKKKNVLSIYTYLNWKRFGVSVAIDDGIKINIAWFETNIKFEKK